MDGKLVRDGAGGDRNPDPGGFEPAAAKTEVASDHAVERPLRILIVDDSEHDATACVRALSQVTHISYDVKTVSCGVSALHWLEGNAVDCVLLDHTLPGPSGLETMQLMRSPDPHLPVIMMTGHGSESIAVRLIKAGAQDYVAKADLSPTVLERAIAAAIDRCCMQRDKERTERALRISEERFQLAAQGANVGIWDWIDVGADAHYWSDEFLRLTGLTDGKTEPGQQALEALIHAEDRREWRTALSAHLHTRAAFRLEVRLRHSEDGYRWFDMSGLAQMDCQGRPQRMIGTIMDIHGRKMAEQAKDEFVSTVNHELRTPLASILGALDIVRSGKVGSVEDRIERLLDMAHQNGQRLLSLINDILDIDALESGQMALNRETVPLDELIASVMAENEIFAQKHGSRIVRTGPPTGIAINVDRIRMSQALTNLISNAAKFSPEGSDIELSVNQRDDDVCLTVRDYGSGIPETFHAQLFNRFTQADGSTTRHVGGTGLGLNICKSIAEAHGGRITFRAIADGGTAFDILLPRT